MVHFGGHIFSTYVANDAVFLQQKVHLEFFFFLPLGIISLLFHFKDLFFCNIP